MREIKFRAWEKDTKQMHEVVQIDFKNWVAIPVPEAVDDDGGVNWILKQRRIKDVELMQYTGLKDKNGKEIYEGDIVKIHNYPNEFKHSTPDFDWRVFEVQWNQTNYAFNNSVIYSPFSRYNRTTLEDYDIEIIGNIYENPELLQDKQKEIEG